MTTSTLWTDRSAAADHDWLTRREAVADEPPPPPPPPRKRRRRLRGAKLLAVIALMAAAGGTGAIVARDDAPGTAARTPAAALPASGGRSSDTDVNAVYAEASKAVASVQVNGGSGTGFLIDADGTIVTNAHVVGSSSSARVRFDDDGDAIQARVVGRDASSDLAVLKVDQQAVAGITPLQFADSDDVEVGDTAIAIGYPLGLDRTATAGIVSGLGRQIEAPNGFSIDEVIQTDAPINPGNSGGPLLDAQGRVIGVNSQIATAGGGNGNVGIGFAVPSNTVREIVPKLQSGGAIERAYLGISTAPDGEVATVTAGSPAARAGLRAGDRLVSVDGDAIDEPSDVSAAIADRAPGDEVKIRVQRGGGEETVSVELGRRPETAP